IRDLDLELPRLVDRDDVSVEAACGHDLVPDLDRVLHLLGGAGRATLWDEHEDEEREKEEGDDDQAGDVGSFSRAEAPSRASAPALYAASSPRSIAARAPAVRSSTKRRLCSVR